MMKNILQNNCSGLHQGCERKGKSKEVLQICGEEEEVGLWCLAGPWKREGCWVENG